MAAPTGTIIEDEKEFLDDVEAFYKERGVPWERDAKVAGRPISLHQLYKTVMEIGGYDKISAERMRWRTLVQPFGLGTTHEPAMTFQLKTVYYKYLAAYEIATFWGEDPPPSQILEDLTAKGGDLRNRKLETYPMQSRTTDARDSDDDDMQRTPVKDKMESEEPGSGRRYPTRELRQDPKRTQMFQPEPTPRGPRYATTTNSPQASPAPVQVYSNASTDPRNPAFNIDNYQPRQPIALTLRPVVTPGNSSEVFYQRKAAEKIQKEPRLPPDAKYLGLLKDVVPHNARNGPSIYTRCHMGLQSGIKEEQAFALHHLVKVSYERGDKFTFKGFPVLAEALIEKALEISKLIYGIRWEISYDQDEGRSTPRTLNACFGTPNLLESIHSFRVLVSDTEPETDDFYDDLERLNEASLVIRNMLTLEENASFISNFPIFKDFLIIAISLPQQPRLTEFRQYALEMAEQTTRYWAIGPNDSLYLSLVAELVSQDRGRVLSALRAINHIGVETDQVFQIADIPEATIERMVSFVLLDDDDLIEAALDFLYEYTAISSNVTSSLQNFSGPSLLPSIVPRLTSLLLHNAVAHEEKIQNRPFPSRQQIKPQIPVIPNDLYMQLLQYPEPERSSRWLRCCFEESPQEDITQIAIWQAYQGRFSQTGHIAAADFIKNVSSTFHQAQAQVINTPPQPRFIIKGIKPRQVLVDVQGRTYFKCLWESNRTDAHLVYDGQGRQRHVCGSWHSTRPNVWYHILQDHCGLQRGTDGKFVNHPSTSSNTNGTASTNDTTAHSLTNGASPSPAPASSLPAKTYKCSYLSCPRTLPFTSAAEFGVHVRGHIPETAEAMTKLIGDLSKIPAPYEVGVPKQKEPSKDDMYTRHTFFYTSTDERGHPCGIPFMAIMVLRNLARFVGRFGGNLSSKGSHSGEQSGNLSPSARRKEKTENDRRQELMGKLFSPVTRAELWHIISVHRTLGVLANDLMGLIDKGEASEKKRPRDEGFDTGVDGVSQEDDGIAH